MKRRLSSDEIEAQVKAFRKHIVVHPRLKQVQNQVLKHIRNHDEIAILLVVGPAGAGKSTLLKLVRQQLIVDAAEEMAADPGHIPVGLLEAVKPEHGRVDWRDFYIRLLIELQEPLIGLKIRHPDDPNDRSVSRYRRVLERALYHRRVQAVLVDEAHHLLTSSSGLALTDRLDFIKSLSNLTGTMLVLAGTHSLLSFADLNGQLIRRRKKIHLARYTTTAKDLKTFQQTLANLADALPFPERPPLEEHWQYCYEQTFGAIGVLKVWLSESLRTALESGAPTLTVKHLQKHERSWDDCLAMLREIEDGEAKWQVTGDEHETIRQKLGFGAPTHTSQQQAADTKNDKKSPRSGRRSPGTRNPGRDPVPTEA